MFEYHKVGDKGKAGGIVFHYWVDGTTTRWMEAAPANMEFTSVWGPVGFAADAGVHELGKLNNEKIIEYSGAKDSAAKRCANRVSYNGVRDWFLPSEEELYLMYKNLKLQGLGDFKDDLYWSSSIRNRDVNSLYTAIVQSFITGVYTSVYRSNVFRVRPIRYFI